jgi:hypothetical protein
MENDRKEDSKLLENYKKLKTSFNAQVAKIKDSSYLKAVNSNLNHLSDITKQYTKKAADRLNNLLIKNKLDLLVSNFIKQTSNKKDLNIKIKDETLTFNYKNRRLLVISFTLGSLIFHSIRHKQLYLKVVIPYFMLYSLLFARENLNPYEL